MANILPPNLAGVEIAIARMRPHAVYQIEGKKFTKWEDPTGQAAPPWTEIEAMVKVLEAEAAEISAALKEINEPVAQLVNSFPQADPIKEAPNPDGPEQFI